MSTDIKNNIQIFKNGEPFFKGVANFIIDIANKSVNKNEKFVIALSGGNTPNQLYSLLATEEYSKHIPWKNTFIFWGDERCVGLYDNQNNAHVAISLLLDKVNIPLLNSFPIPVNLPPEKAALQYEQTITSFFGKDAPVFDLILLGLGENAHTASLFPGTNILTEQNRLVKEVYVEEQKMFRVTMTAPLINRAKNIAFLLTGQAKAEVLKTVLTAPYQPNKYPAQLIKPTNGKLFWLVDEEAASLV
jgi:6-phosphogluconolactonase